MDADPAAVERLARRYKRQKEFQLEGPLYKRLKGHEGEILEEWYNRKWLGLLREEDFGGALLSADFPKTLAESYQRLMPYYDMFARFRMTGGEETK